MFKKIIVMMIIIIGLVVSLKISLYLFTDPSVKDCLQFTDLSPHSCQEVLRSDGILE